MQLKGLLEPAMHIAGGLDAAHSHGIVYRHTKPANIFYEARSSEDMNYGLANLSPTGASSEETTHLQGPTSADKESGRVAEKLNENRPDKRSSPPLLGARYRDFASFNEAEFMQYRKPVGAGPSSKTWPR